MFSSNVILNKNVLIIKNFNTKDNGVYVCKLFASDGRLLAKTELDMKLENQNAKIPVQKPKATIHVYNGQNLSFDNRVKVDCESLSKSDPYSSIKWIRSDSEMPTESNIIENSLIIDNFGIADLGEYKCVLSNKQERQLRQYIFMSKIIS